MKSNSARVISFHYTLTDPSGRELDSSRGAMPLTYMEGVGQIIPGLESEIKKLVVGDKKNIKVAAADAYGVRDENLIVNVPRDRMPVKEFKVGDQFQASHDDHSLPLTVVEITQTHVKLDGNHPLSGVDLTFDVEITEIRDATPEELSHGHAHGPGGHHH